MLSGLLLFTLLVGNIQVLLTCQIALHLTLLFHQVTFYGGQQDLPFVSLDISARSHGQEEKDSAEVSGH